MVTKRIIPCLDVRDGKVTKGVAFKGNMDVGDPVEMARFYYENGADELVFYDITASNEKRNIMIEVVSAVAGEIFIPFSVGGGLRTIDDMRAVLLAGAEKISIDSGAVRDPSLISRGAEAFGSQCVVLSMQVKNVEPRDQVPSGYEIYIDGGRRPMGLDALEWSQRGVELGAGELVINSIDQDGTKSGYELDLTGKIAELVSVPVIASGGAGNPEHLRDVFLQSRADAAIVASITHYGEFSISSIKSYLQQEEIPVRNVW
ncbi:MAG: imidazole glycerol phosphate synthase subunit HisF [Candidatus Poribacteria bacterium]|jgi:cyclase|nr:imidazole glycerol phosphate synthase subunit HisF [Candidatus Poribacteria bacterium]MEC9257851.1 imidazole glycerol phosphate synthase subunit HisF [Candidatus Poribacteria bacterium]|tara:strand:+ start:421 stop:1200 length:780 start_codon:yes stop_codon:yes gene_type:complete